MDPGDTINESTNSFEPTASVNRTGKSNEDLFFFALLFLSFARSRCAVAHHTSDFYINNRIIFERNFVKRYGVNAVKRAALLVYISAPCMNWIGDCRWMNRTKDKEWQKHTVNLSKLHSMCCFHIDSLNWKCDLLFVSRSVCLNEIWPMLRGRRGIEQKKINNNTHTHKENPKNKTFPNKYIKLIKCYTTRWDRIKIPSKNLFKMVFQNRINQTRRHHYHCIGGWHFKHDRHIQSIVAMQIRYYGFSKPLANTN